jgi:GH25 family lysozyme M1 (1,4-beta-N-acetylmuramidase)
MIEGIDVSYYQGQISWPKVAAAGKKFAIIRGGDGTFLDPMFETYLDRAKAVGLYVDIYHYLRFGLSPEHMARICNVRHLMATHYNPKVRLWLDWEDTSPAARAMTMEERREWARKLLDNLHCPIGHYSAGWWWNPYMGCFNLTGPKWVAHYRTGGSPVLPSGWDGWQVWQYGSSGGVDGIEGDVDINVAQAGFFPLEGGDMDEVQTRAIAKEEALKVLKDARLQALFKHPDGRIFQRVGKCLFWIPNPAAFVGSSYDWDDATPTPASDPIWKECVMVV